MKLIVVSDTHRFAGAALRQVAERAKGADYIIHCGDGAADLFGADIVTDCKKIAVRGNCDFGTDLPLFRVIELDTCKALVTHGHEFGVKSGLDSLCAFAASNDCSLVLYGHTHRAAVEIYRGITFVNPGSLCYPTGDLPTFAEVTEGKFQPESKIVSI